MSKQNIIRIILGVAVIGLLVWLFMSGVTDKLTLENLKENRDQLQNWVENNYVISVIVFMLLYTISVAVSVPGATVFTLAGGFLFGFWGIVWVDLSATMGATLAFLASRYLLGNWVQEKYGQRLQKFNEELDKNGPNYLLTLRLIPIFPFFLINLFGGLTRIRLWTFFWTTAVGIFPGGLAYVLAGRQLGEVDTLGEVLSPLTLTVFILLGILAVLPVVWKKWKRG